MSAASHGGRSEGRESKSLHVSARACLSTSVSVCTVCARESSCPCACIHVFVCRSINVNVCLYVPVCLCISVCMFVCADLNVYVCLCVFVYLCVSVCMFACIRVYYCCACVGGSWDFQASSAPHAELLSSWGLL